VKKSTITILFSLAALSFISANVPVSNLTCENKLEDKTRNKRTRIELCIFFIFNIFLNLYKYEN
jgi:uncharacterized membrane protein YbjE (DUF340 family)